MKSYVITTYTPSLVESAGSFRDVDIHSYQRRVRPPLWCEWDLLPLSLSVAMGSSSKEDTASDGDTASGGASPSNDGRLFTEGERVLAYHGPRVYGAKAIQTLSL